MSGWSRISFALIGLVLYHQPVNWIPQLFPVICVLSHHLEALFPSFHHIQLGKNCYSKHWSKQTQTQAVWDRHSDDQCRWYNWSTNRSEVDNPAAHELLVCSLLRNLRSQVRARDSQLQFRQQLITLTTHHTRVPSNISLVDLGLYTQGSILSFKFMFTCVIGEIPLRCIL